MSRKRVSQPPRHPWIPTQGQKDRQAYYLAFVGVNGTGKSTMMKNFLSINKRNLILPSNMLDARHTWGRYPIITPQHDFETDAFDPKGKKKRLIFKLPGIKTFTGSRLVDVSVFREIEHKTAFFENLCDIKRPEIAYTKGGLYVDDTRNYIHSKGNLPMRVIEWLVQRRHIEMDIFLAYHAFQDVNAELIQYKLKFFIFQTDLPPNDTVLDKIELHNDLIEMRNYVNKKARTDPHYFEPFDPVNPEANEIWRKYYRS